MPKCDCGGKAKKTTPGLAAKDKAEILKALAHPDRIKVFEFLADGEKQVAQIVGLLNAKESNTSRHLAVMRNAGIVETRKDGLKVYYSIKMPCLLSMLGCMEEAVCDMADEKTKTAKQIRRGR